MRKFLKNWGALTVAIVALVGSVYALYLDNKHLELQQTQHEEAMELGSSALEADTQHHQEALEGDTQHHQEAMELARSALEADTQHHQEAMELGQTALDIESKHYQELNKQFEEVIEPKTRHDEIYDYISLLYDRLVLYREWLGDLQYAGLYNEYNVVYPYYREASRNFCKAEEELRAGNFDQAEQSVRDTYASLGEGYEAVLSVEVR